jgi:hypothetical protein
MLIIIRGLPGSGKSTFARQNFSSRPNFEADMFFINAKGKYNYDSRLVKYAHQWCQSCAARELSIDKNAIVVVSNTFTTLSEVLPYFEIAKDTGHGVQIYTALGEYKSIHNVPEEVIEAMAKRWVATSLLEKVWESMDY